MSAQTRIVTLAMFLPAAAFAQSVSTSTPAPAVTESAEEAAILAEMAAGDAAPLEPDSTGPSLRFHGFADFSGGAYLGTKGTVWAPILDENMSFAVGNLNLYVDAQIADGWSSLAEIRFMFLPHGAAVDLPKALIDPVSQPAYQSGATADYTNFDRKIDIGSIHIERVYLQLTAFSFLTVRAGRFLTPYGIWNVDHGSPTIIGTKRPYVIGEQFFPEAQTGFEVLGSVSLGDSTLGYHLTISNGRGPAEVYRDLDGNKALGGRLYVTTYLAGQLDVGISGYVGTYTDRRRTLDLSSGQPKIVNFDYEKYDEVALSADLKWSYGSLLLQSEVSMHDRVWDDNARPPSLAFDAQPGQTQPDVRRFGGYLLAGYRLPWLDIMPYGVAEYYDTGMFNGLLTSRRVVGVTAGLNVSPVPGVVLKAQFLVALFDSGVDGTASPENLNLLDVQAAWAF